MTTFIAIGINKLIILGTNQSINAVGGKEGQPYKFTHTWGRYSLIIACKLLDCKPRYSHRKGEFLKGLFLLSTVSPDRYLSLIDIRFFLGYNHNNSGAENC